MKQQKMSHLKVFIAPALLLATAGVGAALIIAQPKAEVAENPGLINFSSVVSALLSSFQKAADAEYTAPLGVSEVVPEDSEKATANEQKQNTTAGATTENKSEEEPDDVEEAPADPTTPEENPGETEPGEETGSSTPEEPNQPSEPSEPGETEDPEPEAPAGTDDTESE